MIIPRPYHRVHGMVRGLDNVSNSPQFEGRFGRLFRTLPPARFSPFAVALARTDDATDSFDALLCASTGVAIMPAAATAAIKPRLNILASLNGTKG